MATMTTAQALADAREKYHLLMTGGNVVEVQDQNGEKIRYGTANRLALMAYIQALEAQLAGTIVGSRPLRVFF